MVVFHNSINQRLGKRSDWTVTEAKNALTKRYFTGMQDLSNAQQTRLEDSLKIKQLQTELRLLSEGQPAKEEEDETDPGTGKTRIISSSTGRKQ